MELPLFSFTLSCGENSRNHWRPKSSVPCKHFQWCEGRVSCLLGQLALPTSVRIEFLLSLLPFAVPLLLFKSIWLVFVYLKNNNTSSVGKSWPLWGKVKCNGGPDSVIQRQCSSWHLSKSMGAHWWWKLLLHSWFYPFHLAVNERVPTD